MDVRKPIFDAIRAGKGSLSPDDVIAIDYVLDRIGIAREATSAEIAQVGLKGIALIQKWEGYAKDLGDGRVQAYPDPATGGAPWTIGWGSTGPDITKGTIWTRAQAQERFEAHIAQFAAEVGKLLGTAPTTPDQRDALISFAYNLGSDSLRTSTLLRKHKEGDYAGAAAEFAKWINANGRPMDGLKARRAEEAALYRSAA